MRLHRNAALGLAGRRRLVALVVEAGLSQRQAARRVGVSPATANRWVSRWRAAGESARRSGACLCDRPSVPRRCPRLIEAHEAERILRARALTNLGPGRLAGITGHARSTIWKVLKRAGRSRLPRAPRPASRRYEWARPGALIHIDTARLARFGHPGHRTRGRGERQRNRGAGWVFIHVAVDDHSRYAYLEQHPDERAETCAAFLERALAHFGELGMRPEAVMTDGAVAYRLARAFAAVLADAGLRHIITPPYTPRWNGKAERLIQTLKREWAYAHEWPSSAARARALSSWVRTYNRRRPHSSLGDRPPISRVHNVRGQCS
jgi:transposase InsO family protein